MDTVEDTEANERVRRDWRYWVGGTGRVLLVIGVLMFGFLAYQLWGTGIEYRQSQTNLEQEFEQRQDELSSTSSVGAGGTTPTVEPAAPTTSVELYPTTVASPTTPGSSEPPTTKPGSSRARWPMLAKGDALAVIEIPSIKKRMYAVAGVAPKDLQRGLGHYPGTPMPGQFGNSAFAGHRTTYGAPLFDIDKLQVGDEIVVRTLLRERFVYVVSGTPRIISSRDASVIATTDPTVASITLTSCHPKYSAKQRIVVTAVLDPAQSGTVEEATPEVDPPAPSDAPEQIEDDSVEPGSTEQVTVSPDEPGDTVADVGSPSDAGTGNPDGAGSSTGDADEGAEPEESVIGETPGLSDGWFSDNAAWWDVVGWGVLAAAIALGGWLLGRRTKRRWLGAVVAAVPFLVVLYFVYQNVNRLLPAGL